MGDQTDRAAQPAAYMKQRLGVFLMLASVRRRTIVTDRHYRRSVCTSGTGVEVKVGHGTVARPAAAEAVRHLARRTALRAYGRPGWPVAPGDAAARSLDAGGRAPHLPRAPSRVGRRYELKDRRRAGGATCRPKCQAHHRNVVTVVTGCAAPSGTH